MLLDNENDSQKVYQWIEKEVETSNGSLDIITGYFTIGALAYLSTITKDIDKYRFILGDIVSTEQLESHSINLLNETLDIQSSLGLSDTAKKAVDFLEQIKVETKTLEPNFCHAKTYIFNSNQKGIYNYFITGSSNLTEAGFGLKPSSNIELNIAETGDNDQHKALKVWFENLWNSKKAHFEKTIEIKNNKAIKKDFKQYLIDEICKIFKEYTPKEIYYKILFEMFNADIDIDNPILLKEIGKLENTLIYKNLYEFQQKGVISLIKMLEAYGGAILADAVGLGKTWSALAVIKYYELQGRETVLLCPKKLEYNWTRYQKRKQSMFENDNFDYVVRFHTDLFNERLSKDDANLSYFQNDKPKLIVIDESHNLRNDKSSRYKFLIEEILAKNPNIKVLLLSATPINNSLKDVRNQFSLMVKGFDDGFNETLGIKSLNSLFQRSQASFVKWSEDESKGVSDLLEALPKNFNTLIDRLVIARTRKQIQKYTPDMHFPKKETPQHIYITPENIGDIKSFDDLIKALPPKLTAYKPAYYLGKIEQDVTKDEAQRDKALVGLMYMLLIKRFESSWKSLYDTILRVQKYHQDIFNAVEQYAINQKDSDINLEDNYLEDEIDDEIGIGKRDIKISQIEACGKLKEFRDDLCFDVEALNKLIVNLEIFKDRIGQEGGDSSCDTKLEKLLELIKDKQKQPNKKMIIFTAYTDTAEYLYNELIKRGINKIALVHGQTKDYEDVLERFAPYTKLFKEKIYEDFDGKDYHEWLEWIKTNDKASQKLLDNPIEILIATDVLSEGQNLQDADMVVNYDIHWNPVRIIQRLGRIDRLGSPNDKIQSVNFWPSQNIDDYLGLQNRVNEKIKMMTTLGTETLDDIKNEEIELIGEHKLLKQFENSIDDIEAGAQTFGFDDLSLEQFRQDLFGELRRNQQYYDGMPKGIYSGFVKDDSNLTDRELVALLYNRVNGLYELIYIDKNGQKIMQATEEILELLKFNQDKPRDNDGLRDISSNDKNAISSMQQMIMSWAKPLTKDKSNDLLKGLMGGDRQAIERSKQDTAIEDEFDIENYDLIAWMVLK
ncbi:MAG: hypothetical protein QG567_1107 [Campylobacterota bacterium]|nr:hypothetical protein [Campylobacterota bacterium]